MSWVLHPVCPDTTSGRPGSRVQPSRTLAAVAFALVLVCSYAGQHLWALFDSTPTDGLVWGERTIPYYWRSYVAFFQGGLAALLTAWLVPDEVALRWLERAWLIGATVGVVVLLTAAFPA